MANIKLPSSFNEMEMYKGGYSPFEIAGQLAISREPSAFDYSELDKKYPVQGVRPVVPAYIQKQIDEEEVLRKSQELEVRRREALLNIYDSQLNQERAMYEQIPIAREALSKLNPADDDFLNQLSAVQASVPIGLENNEVQKFIVEPLVRRHEMLQRNKLEMESRQKPKEEGEITERDLITAGGILSDVTTQNKFKRNDPGAIAQIQGANEIIRRWEQQQQAKKQGLQPQPAMPSVSPAPSGVPVPSATPKSQSGGVRAFEEFYMGQ